MCFYYQPKKVVTTLLQWRALRTGNRQKDIQIKRDYFWTNSELIIRNIKWLRKLYLLTWGPRVQAGHLYNGNNLSLWRSTRRSPKRKREQGVGRSNLFQSNLVPKKDLVGGFRTGTNTTMSPQGSRRGIRLDNGPGWFSHVIKSGGLRSAPGRTFKVLILTFRSVWYMRKCCATPWVTPLDIGMMLLHYVYPPTWHVAVRLPSSLDFILFTTPVVK